VKTFPANEASHWFCAAAGREGAAHSQPVERRDNHPDPAAMVQPVDRDHRRGKRETLKRTISGAGGAKKDRGAHRMRESDPWTRAFALQDLRHEGAQVAFKLRKIVDVSPVGVAQRPVRPALTAPVHRRNGKAAGQQFADHLEIFLDELPAPAEKNDCSDRRRWRPARRSQPDAVGGADIFLNRAGRRGILGRRDQSHRAPR
jgi:hypothetical protein